MKWVWELKKWPHFENDAKTLVEYEKQFHINTGKIIGITSHLNLHNLEQIKIDILTQEALSTSMIEGEVLQSDSVKSSIRKHFGLKTDSKKIPANAYGIAEMMTDVYLNFDKPITDETFFEWHKMIFNGRRDIKTIGSYRTHEDAMQIISGNLSNPTIFYEAPSSLIVKKEMKIFINWCNNQLSNDSNINLIALFGIAHLYFEIIHPFEDGNGRIGRALVEKIISLKNNSPSLISFSKIIDKNKKEYYLALQACNSSLNINKWLQFFGKMLLEAQDYTILLLNFILDKIKFFARFTPLLNNRQEKVLLRIFNEGVNGFKGGLSAANYRTIASTSTATATRDLQELVSKKILTKSGELKSTRYFINLKDL